MECQTGAIGLNEDIQNGFLIFRMSSWNFNFLSASPAKSSSLDFETKNIFLHFFVSEKGLVHIYKKAAYYFPVPYFCFATSQS